MSLSVLPTFTRIYLVALAALLGLVMGSALNCLAFRLARGEKWSGGRSKCPACGHVLGAAELVPLFSWLFLKGRCRHCGASISVRYPITELTLGVIFAAMVLRFGLSLQTLTTLILCACLFCLSLVDLEVQLIPDRFLLIPAAVRLTQLLFEGGWRGLLRGLWPALALGAVMLLLVLCMDRLLHKESMGGGDIKLFAMLGLWFSFPCCLFLLLAACVIGLLLAAVLVRMKRGAAFAFGPAISAAAVVTLLAGEPVVNWYLGLFLR